MRLLKKLMIQAALVAAVVSIGAQAQQPIVLKFSHVVAPNTPKGKGAEFFKKRAEELTGGKVKIEIYPNSQLFKDSEELDGLKVNAVHILAPSLAKFSPLGVREFEVFDIPYIFPDEAALKRIQNGPLGKRLLSLLEPKGIKGLAFWDNGFKVMSANRELRSPKDMRGLKMRIQSSKVLAEQMKALRAIPQSLAFSEVYQALQTGVVDGTENPPSNMYTQKMHEVQKHAIKSDHGYIGYVVIVNNDFWKTLPADIRTSLEKAMDEATVFTNDIARKENEDALKAIIASGKTTVIMPTEAEKKEWVDALMPVRKAVADRVGADLIREFEAEVNKK